MLARAQLERDASTKRLRVPAMSNMGFRWLESGVPLKTAGEEDAFHVLRFEHNNTTAKMRGERKADKREAREAKQKIK